MSTAGQEAADLAAESGLFLDPWQRRVVDLGLSERRDGSNAASTVKVLVSRQNGKNVGLEAVELHDIVLAGVWWIHTAHLFTATRESFQRLYALVEANPDVKDRMTLKYASPMSGYEMRFKGGGRVKFIARSRTSGRGLSGDKIAFDEDQDLNDEALGALLPVASASSDPQFWFLGSAPGLESPVGQRLRARGRSAAEAIARGDKHPDPRLAYVEHSAPPDADPDDPDAWAMANPSLGTRMTEATIADERRSMSPEMFARERLSISPELRDMADDDALPGWFERAGVSDIVGSVAFAVDVPPDRRHTSIAVAGLNGDGLYHLELIDYLDGTAGAVARLVELRDKWGPVAIALDPAGPAGELLAPLERAGVEVRSVSTREHGQACGALSSAVANKSIVHLGDPKIGAAVRGAKQRSVGDAWLWDRKKSDVDLSPLVAVTLARWVHEATPMAQQASPGFVDLAGFLDD